MERDFLEGGINSSILKPYFPFSPFGPGLFGFRPRLIRSPPLDGRGWFGGSGRARLLFGDRMWAEEPYTPVASFLSVGMLAQTHSSASAGKIAVIRSLRAP